jgi:hypothetical protein
MKTVWRFATTALSFSGSKATLGRARAVRDRDPGGVQAAALTTARTRA